jgi:hypothetical protein
MSPAMKTEDACSSKRCDCAVNLLILTSEALFQFQGSLSVIFSGKYFGATNFTPISSSAPPPLPDGIITPLNYISFHLCLMLYNLDHESPKRFGTGPQMLCPGSRTEHVNTTASERVIYFTDKLCHFLSRYKA